MGIPGPSPTWRSCGNGGSMLLYLLSACMCQEGWPGRFVVEVPSSDLALGQGADSVTSRTSPGRPPEPFHVLGFWARCPTMAAREPVPPCELRLRPAWLHHRPRLRTGGGGNRGETRSGIACVGLGSGNEMPFNFIVCFSFSPRRCYLVPGGPWPLDAS